MSEALPVLKSFNVKIAVNHFHSTEVGSPMCDPTIRQPLPTGKPFERRTGKVHLYGLDRYIRHVRS